MVRIRRKYIKFVCESYVFNTVVDSLLIAVWVFLFVFLPTPTKPILFLPVVPVVSAIYILVQYVHAPLAFRLVKIDNEGISVGKRHLSWFDIEEITIAEGDIKIYHGWEKLDDLFGSKSFMYFITPDVWCFNCSFVDFKTDSGLYFTINRHNYDLLQKHCGAICNVLPPFERAKRYGNYKKPKRAMFDCLKLVLALVVFSLFHYFAFDIALWKKIIIVAPIGLLLLKKIYEILFGKLRYAQYF